MRRIFYQGFTFSNTNGKTDNWTLVIGNQVRVGSLFELRRQVHFFSELGILPPPKISKANLALKSDK
ncbi:MULTISPECIES: DUF3319 domain-containing protein [unclassified Shewanella]|jgi:hypothetical protein|uniref:DUF3319 domain-containing protein n=1 Tax=unclassified Shewanella TaxID=196818 RepID=UPI000C31EBDF|nr:MULTISPECIES: DUF3319 domain-containing protein [unclassified Shewanella]MBB1361364.1 DUF3319 domain-containing protein [Shewanella sp. SR44-4]PKH33336.1 hypothetical protein CXF88_04385 [Shewanella sp. ALD9]QHS12633.1 DUF3319 domain-containing protein [Shewanella sp. Arc9-LZ]